MIQVGILGVAHMHVYSYASELLKQRNVELVGYHEPDEVLKNSFGSSFDLAAYEMDSLIDSVDAVIVGSANADHFRFAIAAAKAGKHILCEKPLATSVSDCEAMVQAGNEAGVVFMTGFPCRFSPAYQQLKAKVDQGEIGRIIAISSTNRGICPFGWFVNLEQSGGGAMIDHVVHVADLLQDLLGLEPLTVQASVGNRMYGQEWEDTAMVLLEYENGVFVTLDSSWSRPKTYKTWGDVAMKVTGTDGILEMDMFGQEIDTYRVDESESKFRSLGYGSDLDRAMIEEFLGAIVENRPPRVTGLDGLKAVKVALRGYESLNEPVFSGTGVL